MLSEGLSWEVFLECDADLLSTGGVDPMAPERSGEEKGARLAEGRDEDEKVFPGKRLGVTRAGGRQSPQRRSSDVRRIWVADRPERRQRVYTAVTVPPKGSEGSSRWRQECSKRALAEACAGGEQRLAAA